MPLSFARLLGTLFIILITMPIYKSVDFGAIIFSIAILQISAHVGINFLIDSIARDI
ncbi:hypothetical protein GCM10008931_43120 [Oceanobacillus oncorhynchi subsp. oncorhynchi]